MGKIYHTAHGNYDDTLSWSVKSWKARGEDKYVTSTVKDNQRGGFKRFTTASPDVQDTELPDGQIAEKAIERIRSLKNKPFFLGVGFQKPHLPFVAPKKYWDMYNPATIQLPDTTKPQPIPAYAFNNSGELKLYADFPSNGKLKPEEYTKMLHGYYASVTYVDAQIGKIMAELKSQGLDKNTVVILWGDHGWKLGEYGEWGKATNVEYDTRVPLIVSTPAMLAKGKQSKALVEFVDIYPSLCELAGLPIPNQLHGKSFAPLLNNPLLTWKEAAFSQYPRERSIMGYSMRTDNYRFTQWEQKDKGVIARELYNHRTDPHEKKNIAGEAEVAEVIKEMEEKLASERLKWAKK